MRWKVKEYLDAQGKTTYALWKSSGLSRTTVYAITANQLDGVQFETMAKLIEGLEKITGQRVELSDVLEVARA